MDKTLRNAIIAGILLISIAFAFYFIHFLPSRERAKERARKYCNQWAYDEARGGQTWYENYFDRCLREQGVSN